MKRIICAVLLMQTVVLGAVAQQLGDLVEFDGIPAFIFYLDETGQHGKAMSIPLMFMKYPKWFLIAKAGMPKDEAMALKERVDTIGKIKISKQGAKAQKELLVDLVGRLTDDGKHNHEQIVSVCNERNISLKEAFPWQYYAQKLGEGWYIPGDKELTQFADFYSGGLGKGNKAKSSGWKFFEHAKTLSTVPAVYWSIAFIGENGLWSSSCHSADWGFRVLRGQQHHSMFSIKKSSWLELFDTSPYKGNCHICPVHDF